MWWPDFFLSPVLVMVSVMVVFSLHNDSRSSRAVINAAIEKNADLLVSSVQELVRIKSVAGDPLPDAPFGRGPADALQKTLALAEDLGFRTKNLDNYIGYAEYGEGDDYVAVLGHLDTVPEGEHWTYPPFGGEIHDGKIYGRGALDDKGPVIAALFGLKALVESGLALSRRVRILFGTDEETGTRDVDHYLSLEPPPVSGFTPDADFPVVFAEKGIYWIVLEKQIPAGTQGIRLLSLAGGTAPNVVPESASALINAPDPARIIAECRKFSQSTGYAVSAVEDNGLAKIHSEGLSAHASTPEEGKNAIMQLVAFLDTLELDPPDLADTIRFFNQVIDMETSGRSFGLALSDDPSGPLTLNVGMLALQDNFLSLTIDIRHPVTIPDNVIPDLIHARIQEQGFFMKDLKYDPPLYYPNDSLLIRTLTGVYRDLERDDTPPVGIGGGTYARRLPNIVAFGPYRPRQHPPIHTRDEYISLEELIADARIYAHALYALAR
jgi:succinyl-diaminopimelate desuccinylase